MKIVHLCLTGSYNDNWNYQDNIIPKYHVKDGHDTTVITTTFIDSKVTSGYEEVDSGEYRLDNGIKIIRLPLRFEKSFLKGIAFRFRLYKGTLETIKRVNPDFIFIHGVQFLDIIRVKKYLNLTTSHKQIKVVVDNHADFSNSATNIISKHVLHKVIWRYCAKIIEPYVSKFYGVIPSRVDFLMNMYNTPAKKTELLVLAADDELVEKSMRVEIIAESKNKFGIDKEDFVVVTGGKINDSKIEIFNLIESFKKIDDENVKLIIFGSVSDNLKKRFNELIEDKRIVYTGWIESNDTYEILAIADLAIFPGRHSVLWEQTVGLGIPLIVKYWEGTTHIDLGGNCLFLYENTVNELYELLTDLITHPERIAKMKKISKEKGMVFFSYKNIAKKVLNQ